MNGELKEGLPGPGESSANLKEEMDTAQQDNRDEQDGHHPNEYGDRYDEKERGGADRYDEQERRDDDRDHDTDRGTARRREEEDNQDGNVLYVTNLHTRCDQSQLIKEFDRDFKDSITDTRVVLNPVTRESRGFAFISFTSPAEADRAMRHMNGVKIMGKEIKVEIARRSRPYERTPGTYKGPASASIKYDRYGRIKPEFADYEARISGGGGASVFPAPRIIQPPLEAYSYSRDRGYDRGYDRGGRYDTRRDDYWESARYREYDDRDRDRGRYREEDYYRGGYDRDRVSSRYYEYDDRRYSGGAARYDERDYRRYDDRMMRGRERSRSPRRY
ncbi:unnamed protein product [Vitrella brassicaformis CCMP3155]|uniref:RRM domain-containing protein n=1 Tax=Vitrella brassicaformis (strain CCMP3155) TaxID=1169540 RepID=A0A0G4EH12_VITBC|nr:unnamed protein product [Vitrella brassicaformis CCMP3155]|eukprot:CEL94758.1 unnamed protein product [Vitrella brassicaformis CCMP3155]